MVFVPTVFLISLLGMQCLSVQCCNGYSSGSPWDSYADSYNYYYGSSAYDYSSSAPVVYVSTYPQTYPYEYYQQPSYNPSNGCQQPIVIVVNGDGNDCDDWCDVLSIVDSLSNTPNEPIYVPYPVFCECNNHNNCDCDCYSDCGCKSCGCGCSDSGRHRDCGCDCDNNYSECKKKRSKSKCGNSRCGCNSDCRCNKCIKHKSDRCCRD